MKKLAVLLVYLGLCLAALSAQTPQTRMQGGNMPPGENVAGKVTAVTADSVTIAPIAGGDPVTVKISDNTRIMKERQPAKLSDVKVDETVVARGALNGKTMDAMMLFVVNPEMLQRMQQGMGAGQGGFNREDLGKKFIAGEVKAINETKLTIARPDNQSQDIEVDENTSFKKGSESVTLADIKVGDFVFGPGEVKDGAFVPKQLNIGRPRMMMVGPGPGAQGAAPDQKKPEAEKPPKP